ncbi:hypothetical protein PUMCH_001280 [Australozyma saopauloensis]|uniref:Autophagy-related protein 9 n=1 Tax=Australozyma saopauloensis TaxID=291208 RepID=A0AAX4H622_9ASCO|nr:hypothetical protein PUMCH_001280 [[Candida] saopauloensis]
MSVNYRRRIDRWQDEDDWLCFSSESDGDEQRRKYYHLDSQLGLWPLLTWSERVRTDTDPVATKNSTKYQKPLNPLYTWWQDAIKILDSDLEDRLRAEPHISEELWWSFAIGTKKLLLKVLCLINEYQRWERRKILSIQLMRDGTEQASRCPPTAWVLEIESFKLRLNHLYHTSIGDWDCLGSERLRKYYEEFLELLKNTNERYLELLKTLYANEFQGVWYTYAIKNKYGFPVLRMFRNRIFRDRLFFLNCPLIFFSTLVFNYWCLDNSIYYPIYLTLGLFGLLFVLLCLSFSTGQVYFHLNNLYPLRRDRLHEIVSLMEKAQLDWPQYYFPERRYMR